jgi:hypothetical protein
MQALQMQCLVSLLFYMGSLEAKMKIFLKFDNFYGGREKSWSWNAN